MIGVHYFYTEILSEDEKGNIQRYPIESDFIPRNERIMRNITDLSNEQFQFYLKCICDRKNTERFYTKVIRTLYTQNLALSELEEKDFIRTIMNKMHFSIKCE